MTQNICLMGIWSKKQLVVWTLKLCKYRTFDKKLVILGNGLFTALQSTPRPVLIGTLLESFKLFYVKNLIRFLVFMDITRKKSRLIFVGLLTYAISLHSLHCSISEKVKYNNPPVSILF